MLLEKTTMSDFFRNLYDRDFFSTGEYIFIIIDLNYAKRLSKIPLNQLLFIQLGLATKTFKKSNFQLLIRNFRQNAFFHDFSEEIKNGKLFDIAVSRSPLNSEENEKYRVYFKSVNV